jgi:tetratricopeptide (TPR) repeat protein
LFVLVWLGSACVVFSLIITLAGMAVLGLSLLQAALLGLFLGIFVPLLIYGLLNYLVVGGVVSFFGRLYGAGDTGSPTPPTYWRAQALSAWGAHADALRALEADAARDPGDPRPCLRAAALCVEELDDRESAVAWYLRARGAKRITAETDAYVSLRLADLYESLGRNPRAMFELGRLVELHPESRYTEGARARLAELKIDQMREHESGPQG